MSTELDELCAWLTEHGMTIGIDYYNSDLFGASYNLEITYADGRVETLYSDLPA